MPDPLQQRTIDIENKKHKLEIDASKVIRMQVSGETYYKWGEAGEPRKTFEEAIRDGFIKLLLDEFGQWDMDWGLIMDQIMDQWGEDFSEGFTWQEDQQLDDGGDYLDPRPPEHLEVPEAPEGGIEAFHRRKEALAPAVDSASIDDISQMDPALMSGEMDQGMQQQQQPNQPDPNGQQQQQQPPPSDMELTINGIPVGRIKQEQARPEDDLAGGTAGQFGWRASGSRFGMPMQSGGSQFSGFRKASEAQVIAKAQALAQKKKGKK